MGNFGSKGSPPLGRRKTQSRVGRTVCTGLAAKLWSLDWRLGSRWTVLLVDATAVGKREKVTGVTAFCSRPESPGGGQMDSWGWLHDFEMPKAGVRAWLGEEPASGKEPCGETGVSGIPSGPAPAAPAPGGCLGTAAPTRPSGTCMPL